METWKVFQPVFIAKDNLFKPTAPGSVHVSKPVRFLYASAYWPFTVLSL